MDLKYDTPSEWGVMTEEERVLWHIQRVEKEEPVFEMLKDTGVFTCFEPDEIRVRLLRVREYKKKVAAALLMTATEEFKDSWRRLNLKIDLARLCLVQQGKILSAQMKRPGLSISKSESESLKLLKVKVENLLDLGETIEGEIIKLCDKFNCDANPFMLVDPIRELR